MEVNTPPDGSHQRANPILVGTACGIGAALLFGLSPPLVKLLLPASTPAMLAGLLYLGAGLGLLAVRLVSRWRRIGNAGREAQLRRSDLAPLVGVIVTGGIVGPVLMLVGLGRVSGSVGSLLLNLEAPFTIALAVVFFREHLGRREALAALVIVAAAALLSFQSGEVHADWLGVLALAGACLSWGLDNNLTQRLSVRDPVAVVQVKALGAGACNVALALVLGAKVPSGPYLLIAGIVGLACYGVSILLDVYALRLLGAAREAALFASAPFVGALASVIILGERLSARGVGALLVMALGVVLLVRARHAHPHTHEPLEHDHLHAHDEHHQHEHPPGMDTSEPHSHAHSHAPLTHDHPHVSDLHHRHAHRKS
ncbi:DMT family transporter [Hyalangium sp.]|uniref:DMT family transporter n=1 Tax=Hyalangium sp. TaxID=2028555 RepID=UPI002D5D0BFE|nr:DMT family transporter [Hyalangium sp.]HYH97999.1 DMT family transporter [Hyalangium sp.]